ncbi:MAG: hypothetical protein AAF602_11190, partial [Myxococcota bacterium]
VAGIVGLLGSCLWLVSGSSASPRPAERQEASAALGHCYGASKTRAELLVAHFLHGSIVVETLEGDVRQVFESELPRGTIRQVIGVAEQGRLTSTFVTVRPSPWGPTRLLAARDGVFVSAHPPTTENGTVHDIRFDAERTALEALVSRGPRSNLELLLVAIEQGPRHEEESSGRARSAEPAPTLQDLRLDAAWGAAFLDTSDEVVAITGPELSHSRLWSDASALKTAVHPSIHFRCVGAESEPSPGHSLENEILASECFGISVSACRLPADGTKSDHVEWTAVVGLPRCHGERGSALVARKTAGVDTLEVTPLTHIAELHPERFLLTPERFGFEVRIVRPLSAESTRIVCLVGSAAATSSSGLVAYAGDGEVIWSKIDEQHFGDVHAFGAARGKIYLLDNAGVRTLTLEGASRRSR